MVVTTPQPTTHNPQRTTWGSRQVGMAPGSGFWFRQPRALATKKWQSQKRAQCSKLGDPRLAQRTTVYTSAYSSWGCWGSRAVVPYLVLTVVSSSLGFYPDGAHSHPGYLATNSPLDLNRCIRVLVDKPWTSSSFVLPRLWRWHYACFSFRPDHLRTDSFEITVAMENSLLCLESGLAVVGGETSNREATG
ncbi:hypothetical protein LZ30DRAFT_462884 [Colletotrichum cereale]|nr:hypothetical protein LZ30DRAFT_462884 [Colletotrichum cereale]